MMVNCPKCGFNQPKDQYCARCGIDMMIYKPNPPGMAKKIFNSSAFYLIIVAVVVFALWHILQQKKAQQMAERLRLTKNTYSNSFNNTPPPSPSSPDTNTDIALTPALPVEGNAVQNSESTSIKEPQEPQLPQISYTVNTKYYEMSLMVLQDFIENSSTNGQSYNMGDYTFGVVENIEKKLAAAQSKGSAKVYANHEELIRKLKNTENWFLGYQNEETESGLGFTTEVTINEITDNVVKGDIELIRNLREGTDKTASPIKRSFPAQFEMNPQQSFFMAGVLPHKALADVEAELLSTHLFQIYQSPMFQNKNSELVIVFQVVKNAK